MFLFIMGFERFLVDDSIVRGTTSLKIVEMMRNAGAREVHMRIASPPTVNPCYYGVDTPEKSELIAANMTLEEMRQAHYRHAAISASHDNPRAFLFYSNHGFRAFDTTYEFVRELT